MATPGKYCDLRTTLILSDDGSNTATLQLRKMAPMGHYRDDYELVHDDGFPETVLNVAEGSEVVRRQYRGPAERVANSSKDCPKAEVCKMFRLEKLKGEADDDRYVLKKDNGDEIRLRWFPDYDRIADEAIAKNKEEAVAKEKNADKKKEKEKDEEEPDDCE